MPLVRPMPLVYANPRLPCATAKPLSAASRNQRTASLGVARARRSRWHTPGRGRSAPGRGPARRRCGIHRAPASRSRGTPSPRWYARPSRYAAPASPCLGGGPQGRPGSWRAASGAAKPAHTSTAQARRKASGAASHGASQRGHLVVRVQAPLAGFDRHAAGRQPVLVGDAFPAALFEEFVPLAAADAAHRERQRPRPGEHVRVLDGRFVAQRVGRPPGSSARRRGAPRCRSCRANRATPDR